MMSESARGDQGDPLSPTETAQLTEHITSLTGTGLPLAPGLQALAEEFPEGRFRRSLVDLSDALDKGIPLDQALEAQDRRIPPHLRGLVRGGIRSGRLGDILGRYASYESVGVELKRKLALSMAYPILTIGVGAALFIFVSVVIVHQFEVIFRDFGVPLPRMTVAMVVISQVLRSSWGAFPALAGLLLICWMLAYVFLSSADRRALATQIPIVGKVWQYISWAELCHLLGLLLESRLPLPEALKLAGEGVQDSRLDRSCAAVSEDVQKGVPFSEALAVQPAFPAGLARLVRWAGERDALAEVLHMAGEMYEARARSQSTFAGTVAAVLTVIMILFGSFTLIIGLFLPLITLISKLSG